MIAREGVKMTNGNEKLTEAKSPNRLVDPQLAEVRGGAISSIKGNASGVSCKFCGRSVTVYYGPVVYNKSYGAVRKAQCGSCRSEGFYCASGGKKILGTLAQLNAAF